ncbi:AbrB family transcriptional regulator [Kurthia sibirica]|uniref:AbrB family transcriptional regulator n=1 Tax=Kurthia sibirica TaxID=202750 RepID=A0A2U3ANI7_9BACL|nr:AbrB family transcriptional regulator [Kurthia sibirica]PWI26103.1 AbrB family transcriptional regulator [Kurthia sibirica]GEK34941.1 aminopeptidase [Kurthia sibirica]
MTKLQLKKFLLTLMIGSIGGLLFTVLHIPIPWLLGPLACALTINTWRPDFLYWPKSMKSIGMLFIGYTIGQALTSEAVKEISAQLPYMFLMTILLIALSAVMALVISKVAKINYQTALLSSIPGGMTQMIVMAEETKDVNLTIVTITQTIRLLLIVIGMPILVFSFFTDVRTADTSSISAQWSIHMNSMTALILILCLVAALLGKKIKFPTAFLLVPTIVTALLQSIGMTGLELSPPFIDLALLFIGLNIALMMKPRDLDNKKQILSLAFFSGALLFVVAIVLGLFFAYMKEIDIPTALLSLAPGGMDQMGVVAHEVDASLPLVAGFQIFRTFFILFVIQPLLVLFLKYTQTKSFSKTSD